MGVVGGLQAGADARAGHGTFVGRPQLERQLGGVEILELFEKMVVVVGQWADDVGAAGKGNQRDPIPATPLEQVDEFAQALLGALLPAGSDIVGQHAAADIEEDDQVAARRRDRLGFASPLRSRQAEQQGHDAQEPAERAQPPPGDAPRRQGGQGRQPAQLRQHAPPPPRRKHAQQRQRLQRRVKPQQMSVRKRVPEEVVVRHQHVRSHAGTERHERHGNYRGDQGPVAVHCGFFSPSLAGGGASASGSSQVFTRLPWVL